VDFLLDVGKWEARDGFEKEAPGMVLNDKKGI
jgi:hypothetical protein